MPVTREIVYPIFLECTQYCIDTFWENIFEELSYGKSPYGTYISKGYLCCNYKKHEFNYRIEKKDALVLYNDVYFLLSKKLGLMSNEEKLQQNTDFALLEKGLKDSRTKSWSEIRRKNVKDLLIELFVTRMKMEHNLTIKQCRYLLSLIFVSLIFKIILSKDIYYNDGKIEKINGINFKKGTISVVKNIYKFETKISTNSGSEKRLLSENWDRYIFDLKKSKEF